MSQKPSSQLVEIDSAELAVFKKKLKELSGYRGRGTELISVYIPNATDRSSVMNQLATEMSQSSNIKSPQTRKNVQSALKKISNFLKQINFQLPANGIVVFAGNISENEGRTDLRLFTIKPIKPLRTKLYWCDSSFHLDPLKEMVVPTDIYAFIVMDKREATIALLVGKRYEIVGHFTSMVAGKTRAGGQCLIPSTQITVPNNKIIPISEITTNQLIISSDLQNYKLKESIVTDKWSVRKTQVKIRTKIGQEIISSPEHIFFTYNPKKDLIEEKIAEELNQTDFLLTNQKIVETTSTGKEIFPIQIATIEKLNKLIPMIDISVNNPNFFANGLLVHNSAQRFEHLREEAAQDFYRKVCDKVNMALVNYGEKLKGIIVGGPGQTKRHFLETEHLDYRLKDKVLGILDLSYTDESGIREIIQLSDELLRNTGLMQEKKILEVFLREVVKDGLAAYGSKEVEHALEAGKVNQLILSEGLTSRIVKMKCVNCGEEITKVLKDVHEAFDESEVKCAKCGSAVEVIEEVDYLDHLLETAHAMGTETDVVSTDTPEGEQFLKTFGGIGALLRYK